jgi:Cu/Zn superoxide dismutase
MKIAMVLAALVCSAALASAQSLFTVNLNGANERPTPNTSPAIGSGTLTLNANNSLSYNITYSGLTADWTANHIHGPATTEQSAGVIFTLSHTPITTRSGNLVGTTPILTAAQLTQLNSQLWYVNIHSVGQFSGGEIRGQIVPVPEPSTWALMGFGAMGTLWYLRRRRAS